MSASFPPFRPFPMHWGGRAGQWHGAWVMGGTPLHVSGCQGGVPRWPSTVTPSRGMTPAIVVFPFSVRFPTVFSSSFTYCTRPPSRPSRGEEQFARVIHSSSDRRSPRFDSIRDTQIPPTGPPPPASPRLSAVSRRTSPRAAHPRRLWHLGLSSVHGQRSGLGSSLFPHSVIAPHPTRLFPKQAGLVVNSVVSVPSGAPSSVALTPSVSAAHALLLHCQ